jgi:hypothetical protein
MNQLATPAYRLIALIAALVVMPAMRNHWVIIQRSWSPSNGRRAATITKPIFIRILLG